MEMIELLFAGAAALFVFSFFRMASRLWQFATYTQSFGSAPNISLDELTVLANERDRDLPAFTVIVPAWDEAVTIAATMRRIAAANYPCTHLDLVVVTYEDEPPNSTGKTTADVARRTADEINAEAGRLRARVESTPEGFDGFFPGEFDTGKRHIGKARGLNFALRRLHERIEADERAYVLGRFYRAGQISKVDAAINEVAAAAGDTERLRYLVRQYFVPDEAQFVGPAALSRQVLRARDLAATLESAAGAELAAYTDEMSPRFFLPPVGKDGTTEPPDAFLTQVVGDIEARAPEELDAYVQARDATLERERPHLATSLAELDDPERIRTQSRHLNTRWVAVFDADADAPPDLFRHLSARILTDDKVMAFQGPVAPVANFDEIHPLCGLAGLWLAFHHATIFPRIMTKPGWAHPLAGTNWCIRIEGMEYDGSLLRSVDYEEARRRFLLSFDPQQLTEDLEAGLRLFSHWRIAAEWHPFLEWEQAPPRPADLIRQWTRWTLGTLQVQMAMLRSNLPLRQRISLAILPIEIITTGLGPALTVILWTILLAGGFQIDSALMPLTVFLTCINVFYAAPFILTLKHFRRLRNIALVGEAFFETGIKVTSKTENQRLDTLRECFDAVGISNAAEAVKLARAYLSSRCIDAERPDRSPLAQAYLNQTPTALREEKLQTSIEEQAKAAIASRKTSAGASSHSARDVWKPLLWVIPFLLFQLLPFFQGFAKWFTRSDQVWRKTPRTPKH